MNPFLRYPADKNSAHTQTDRHTHTHRQTHADDHKTLRPTARR